MIWIAEAYGFDAVSLCGYLAAVTERAELATGIFPVYSRTPALLAQTAAGLDALSDGRFVLGLGASGPQVVEGWHGVVYDKPVARIREVIEICRMAWQRERLEYHGRVFELPLPADQGTGLGKPIKMINTPGREDIPIYVASLGEKWVEMCAEVANGWLPYLFIPERADSGVGLGVTQRLAKRDAELGRSRSLPAVCWRSALTRTFSVKRRDPVWRCTSAAWVRSDKNFYNDVVCSYGYGDAARAIQDLYLAGKKDEAAPRYPTSCSSNSRCAATSAMSRERVAAWRDAGVTNLNVAPVGADSAATMAQFREIVG